MGLNLARTAPRLRPSKMEELEGVLKLFYAEAGVLNEVAQGTFG